MNFRVKPTSSSESGKHCVPAQLLRHATPALICGRRPSAGLADLARQTAQLMAWVLQKLAANR